jgi:hypothetical protein
LKLPAWNAANYSDGRNGQDLSKNSGNLFRYFLTNRNGRQELSLFWRAALGGQPQGCRFRHIIGL